jgi:beta-galactosidase
LINEKHPKIWFGGDYNPDQWPKDIWDEDMRLFKSAHVDVATLPVFSWSILQPDEDTYDFSFLDEVLELLSKNHIFVCLATSTAAHPAWMARRYPDILRVDFEGRKRSYGIRHNSCPNSPTYRLYSQRLADKLAGRYKDYPKLVAWHVSNEYGGGPCYCDNCAKAFRVWLQNRYGSLEELNKHWCTRVWSHTFYDWEEIVPPNILSEYISATRSRFPVISLDYQRFYSESLLECFKLECRAIKRHTPEIPITTNLMGAYKPLNYFEWAKYMDIVSWDNYPAYDEEPSLIAFRHDLMRGLKAGKPFMVMEQASSQTNWQRYNVLRRPKVMRLWSYQAVAHGADTVMFFQLRRCQGGCEILHSGLIDHVGHENTRVFQECRELGRELADLGDNLLDAVVDAKAAIVFDWENWWALEFCDGPSVDLTYLPQVLKYYKAFWQNNIPVDFISPEMDLNKYDVVVAPVQFLQQDGYAQAVERYVKNGGTYVATFFSGIVDASDRAVLGGYPGGLKHVLGIWNEEIDVLPPDVQNRLVIEDSCPQLVGTYPCGLICDLVHAQTATVIATYGDDFYQGRPALTKNDFGQGTAWYMATDPDQAFLDKWIRYLCLTKGITPLLETPAEVEVIDRKKGKNTYRFILNHSAQPVQVDLGKEEQEDLLSKRRLKGLVQIAKNDLLILKIINN